ncbi:FxSxx-COOH cyclophane-containing RiPP peptide [Streptomyces tailanensis]|uniref:FxSxx-COOH cyclophane-containing RiPP peptide n=1 Tax=Streptomyces tailanensis TaxID=2569858 RepID=UPI00122E8892|nr:FxSxx-COOH cyclophane-containing RiPP peptide [Streptomyces tailanensis]
MNLSIKATRGSDTARSAHKKLAPLAAVAADAPRTRRSTGRVTDARGSQLARAGFTSSI